MDELANESEHELLFYLHEAIGAVVKTHGNTFLPAFTEEVMPLMQQMSQPNSLESDRKMVIFIYDDVVEFGGAQVQQTLLPVMFPAFLEATSPHEQQSLRQGGAYGIGVSASSGGQFFTPYATTATQALVACISTPDAFDSANGPASDNCVSALGKCIAYHAAHLPNARLLMVQHFLPKLPLRSDEEESRAVTNHFCAMLEDVNMNRLVLGASCETLGPVLSILGQVVGSKRDEGICNKALRTRIATLIRGMAQSIPQQTFTAALGQVQPQVQQILQAVSTGAIK